MSDGGTGDINGYLQLFLTLAAAGGIIWGGIKWVSKFIKDKVTDELSTTINTMEKEHENIRRDVSLLKQSIEYIEKYFTNGMKLKGNKDNAETK